MLVLTRKQSETIRIGDSITITVLRMKGKSVRLGIEAPLHMSVIRGELSFEQGDEKEVVAEADEIEEPSLVKPKSRASTRQFPNDAWPTKPNHATGCAAAAWSI